MKLSPTEIFNGRNVFIIGGTGFVGKVAVCMLLYRFPNIGKVYITVRARNQAESENRFWNSVITSPPFDPLRERYGNAFEGFIKEKVVVVGGDVGETNLGFPEEDATRIAQDVDVVLNSSGNVTFSPPLEHALRTNVVGTQNVIAFVKRMKRPALVHISTCFVAGNRTGAVWESDDVKGYFPRREEMPDVEFDVEKEIEDCARLAIHVREDARDSMHTARFRELARERLSEEGRDTDDLDAMGLAVARERKMWIRERLSELGQKRAQYWGWPNIYTYTKSLGEQLVAREDGIVKSIVRPSIVESAAEFPFPGWNEGFTTTAPLIFISFKGQTIIPANDNLILDITPVDHVAAVMLAVSAQAMVEEPRLVHQAATSDSNPNNMKRIVGLVGLYKRTHYAEKESGNKLLNNLQGRLESRPVSYEYFDKYSAPMFNRAAKRANTLLEKFKPRWGGGRISDVIEQLQDRAEEIEKFTDETKEAFELFKPFTNENEYVFRADNTRALFNKIREEEQNLLLWTPEKIDWYDYWMNVHFPGLKKWVFPTLEDEMRVQPKRVYTYRDILELFSTTTKRHATRVAMRIERDGQKEQYTYADLQELATRAATFFIAHEIKSGNRVMLVSHNMPEWGMTYFGALKAGATCIPVDPESSLDDIVTFARNGEAAAIILSPRVAEKFPALADRLQAENLSAKIWTFDDVFALEDEATEAERTALLPQRVSPNSVASLIFTSGTTGQPKAVMLSHKNLTSMTSMLTSIIETDTSDGVLSVLPLYHTFEFSAGFLAPLSRGAQITYLEELDGEHLNQAIQNGYVTGMVGVPALWELLHRRIQNKFSERGRFVDGTMQALIRFNSWVRKKTPFNLGQVLFFPIHQGMGGRIRYFISGGSALNDKVQKDFYGMGFNMLEGYGLTEAAPVITVTRPGNELLIGSVGRALPGVEVQILDPNAGGVGEIVARGANVMLGYYNNESATGNTLVNRWLHTGDLGRLDDEGNLYIVGRSKEIIIDTNGKNVYPDEVEELYQNSPYIEEMSVVGLPDGSGEKVAALVHPNYGYEAALRREETRRKIEEHFKDISSALPFYKRVKVLHFTDEDLPRTATRKIKRRAVVELILELEENLKTLTRESVPDETRDANAWLLDIVAQVANRPRRQVRFDSRLTELGFDSLMYVELATQIENAGGVLHNPNTLNEVFDVRELATLVSRGANMDTRRANERQRIAEEQREDEELKIPSFLRAVGNIGVDFVWRQFYENFLHTKIEGRGNIPVHTNFIVAPNHNSHLDMGLTKFALGEAGEDMVALAAADYFFDNKYKRAVMENFTSLVPMERSGSLRQSLRHARALLEQGHNALIFPEGTRSLTGEMADFKPVIGYLALTCKIGILPMYLWGTHEAFPKGASVIRSRDVGARIGRYLEYDELLALTAGMPKSEAYRLIAAYVEHEVINLRDKAAHVFDAKALRAQFKQERRANAKSEHKESLAAVGD